MVFPELPAHAPEACTLFEPALLRVLARYGSAQAIAQTPVEELTRSLHEASRERWTQEHAHALRELAEHSAASPRAVAARRLVVRTMAQHLLDLQQRLAELQTAMLQSLEGDGDGQHLQTLPCVGPVIAATIRAELVDYSCGTSWSSSGGRSILAVSGSRRESRQWMSNRRSRSYGNCCRNSEP